MISDEGTEDSSISCPSFTFTDPEANSIIFCDPNCPETKDNVGWLDRSISNTDEPWTASNVNYWEEMTEKLTNNREIAELEAETERRDELLLRQAQRDYANPNAARTEAYSGSISHYQHNSITEPAPEIEIKSSKDFFLHLPTEQHNEGKLRLLHCGRVLLTRNAITQTEFAAIVQRFNASSLEADACPFEQSKGFIAGSGRLPVR